ncbi:MAG: hypothetical protein A3F75_06265 [Betaproteobacteria bacterium RIFCSPLOWO2_12_FULL_64_23]|nr:MAG: hypothetical protein A3F75_06265 [Betaproteobacteria bacterium RIFCSPLOWO2_12_FULL_64_23]
MCLINWIVKEFAMRLYAPLYEGDSILRSDAALGEPAVKVFRSPAPARNFVRSSIQVKAANETALDIHAIEQIARRQRNAEIARMLKALFTAVGDWFERNENFERDNFFAASGNLADLEQRQRHFERTGRAHY